MNITLLRLVEVTVVVNHRRPTHTRGDGAGNRSGGGSGFGTAAGAGIGFDSHFGTGTGFGTNLGDIYGDGIGHPDP